MTNKIKFRLEVWSKTLLFQVLEMDKRFLGQSYTASNGVIISSEGCPELWMRTETQLFLHGSMNGRNFDVITFTFSKQEDARNAESLILEALKEWATKWEGFNSVKKSHKVPVKSNLYEF